MNEWSSNHLKAPKCASFVARMRNVFGNANVQVLYVKEGEVELGRSDQVTYATVYQTTVHEDADPRSKNEARKEAA
jgi:hypothetical protein